MIWKTPTLGMSRQEWLAARKGSLGGSDMGAVLGLNPYSSPYAVWAEKTGRIPESEDNEAMRQGRDLEEYVASRFTEFTGMKCRKTNAIWHNDLYPHLHAIPDRLIVAQRAGLECKTASALSASRFAGGEFPASYYAQTVTYLAVTGYERWYLAVLILGKEFKAYMMTTIKNDTAPEWCSGMMYVSPEEIEALTTAGEEFWAQYVEADEEPPVDGLPATMDALQVIYRDDNGGTVNLFGYEEILASYMDIQDSIEELKADADRLKQEIMQTMGEAAKGSAGPFSVTWKTQTRRLFDSKRFAADHPDMDLSAYYKDSVSRPFKIKKEA